MIEREFIGKGSVKGFKFKQERRHSYTYLYSVDNGKRVYYDVFRMTTYPDDEDFGYRAWTFLDRKKADELFDILAAYGIRRALKHLMSR